jgi:hypothetical protein
MPLPTPTNHHLPPHLREVCDLLARGLLRLRSRAAAEAERDARDGSEVRLHTLPCQRPHANPTARSRA